MLFKRKDETDFHEVILDTDSESYTLTKLEEWMQYEVKMNAFNDVGSSPYSPISMERTRDASMYVYRGLCIDANHYDFSVIVTNFGPKLRCYGQQSSCYGFPIIVGPEPFSI
jgi:hypothetical protein